MGDEVQAIKAGLLEVADIVVVNKGDRPGAQRTAAQLRAMLVPTVARKDADPSRPAPKRPEVLVTTALTGDGVPALLAALERHRAAGADGVMSAVPSRPSRGAGPRGPDRTRLAAADDRRARRGHGRRDRRGRRSRARPLRGCRPAPRGRAGRPVSRPSHPAAPLVTRPFLLLTATATGLLHRGWHGPAGGLALRHRDPLGPMRSGRASPSVRSPSRALAMRPVVGWASDRYGRRPLLIGGALLTVIALLRPSRRVNAARLRRRARCCSASPRRSSSYRCSRRPATWRHRSDAARRSTSSRCRSTSGWPSGRLWARLRSARAATRPSGSWPRCSRGSPSALAVPAPGDGACRRIGCRRTRPDARCIHPAAVFPGLLVGCGAFGMAGFLAFIPLYARADRPRRCGDPAGGLRPDRRRAAARVRQAARPGRGRPAVRRGARGRGDRPPSSRLVLRSPLGLVVGTAVYAAGVAFIVSGAAVAGSLARRRDGAGNGRGDRRACSSTHRSGSRRLCSAASRCRGGSAAPSSSGAVMAALGCGAAVRRDAPRSPVGDPGGVRSGA